MNSINSIVWMLPILFMFHDFEEIILAEAWNKRYKDEIEVCWPKRQPFGLDYIRFFPTPTISWGVYVEFILYALISLLTVITQNYFIWFAFFIGVTLHLVLLHIPLCIQFRHYVPGIVTAMVALIPSVWFLIEAAYILHYTFITVALATVCSLVLMLLLIPILHKLTGPMSACIQKYAKNSEYTNREER
jgi:hypothetical protein